MRVTNWFRQRLWRAPRWLWLIGGLLLAAAWWGFAPKPAPLAPSVAAAPLALEGRPIPQPRATIGPTNAAQVVQFAQAGEDTPRLFAVAPDGRWLAAGSPSDMAIYATQSLSRTELLATPFRIGTYRYSNLAVASDGATVAAIDGFDLWLRPANGAARLITNHGTSDQAFTSLVFAPDSAVLAAADGVDIHLFRASDGALLRSYHKNYGNEQVLTFSPDGVWLLTSSGTRVVMRGVGHWWAVWPRATETSLDADVSAASFSHDGAFVALGTEAGQVTILPFAQGVLGDERTVARGLPPVTSVAFAPDGVSLAVGARGGSVRLVNVSDGTPEAMLLAHTRPLSATLLATFAPDGSLVTAAAEPFGVAPNGFDGRATMRRWRAADGAQLGEHLWTKQALARPRLMPDAADTAFTLDDRTTRALPDAADTAYLALGTSQPRLWRSGDGVLPPLAAPGERWIAGVLSVDGATLAVLAANGTDVYLVRVADGALLHTIGNGLPVEQIALTPDSAMVLLGHRASVTRWQARAGTALPTLPGRFAALAPNGALLATAQAQHVYVWQVAESTPRYGVDVAAERVNTVAFAPDGTTLAVGDQSGVVALFRAADGTALGRLPQQGTYLRTVAFAPDSATLACLADDNRVRLWHIPDGALLHTLGSAEASIDSMRFAPNGSTLATGSAADAARVWRVADGALLRAFADHTSDLAFSSDGTQLVSDGDMVRVWRVADGTQQGPRTGPQAWRRSMDSPDGALRLTSGVGLWRTADGGVVGAITEPFNTAAFAPDGQMFLTTALGGVTKLYRSADGGLVHTLKAPNYTGYLDVAVFAPDGATVATATRAGDVLIWRVADGTLLRTLTITAQDGGFFRDVESLAYTPDGSVLAAGTSNGRIWLWSVADGVLQHTLRGHGDEVTALAFTPDATRLVSASRDGTTRQWGVP